MTLAPLSWARAILLLLCPMAALAQPEPEPSVRVGPIKIYEHHRNSRDRIAVGHDIVIPINQTNHDVTAVGGNVTVDGTVEGDLIVVLGSVKLGPEARVRRDLIALGNLEVHPSAEIKGERIQVELPLAIWEYPRQWFTKGLLWGRPLPHQFAWAWVLVAISLLFYAVVAGLLPKPVGACADALQTRPATSFFLGLLVFVLLGPLLFLLTVSVVGVVGVPLVFCLLAALIILGKVTVYCAAGRRMLAQFGSKAAAWPVIALIPGALLFFICYMLPVVGFVIWGLVTTVGLGAVVLAAVNVFRSESPASAAVPVQPAVLGTASSTSSGAALPPAEPLLLPRAGFWLRLVATLLDAILVGTVMMLFRSAEATMIVWVLYHFAMWSWKGTTIGGIVVGLRIIRRDGSPIRYGEAVVRCLSAFFSALVLFLGFFWAGWDPEKQSWHDKIAGTIVVKVPSGTSLV